MDNTSVDTHHTENTLEKLDPLSITFSNKANIGSTFKSVVTGNPA